MNQYRLWFVRDSLAFPIRWCNEAGKPGLFCDVQDLETLPDVVHVNRNTGDTEMIFSNDKNNATLVLRRDGPTYQFTSTRLNPELVFDDQFVVQSSAVNNGPNNDFDVKLVNDGVDYDFARGLSPDKNCGDGLSQLFFTSSDDSTLLKGQLRAEQYNPATENPEEEGLNVGEIVGIIVGILLFLLFLGVLIGAIIYLALKPVKDYRLSSLSAFSPSQR